MFNKKRKDHTAEAIAEIAEARELRAVATQELKEITASNPYIALLSAGLIQRKIDNHFGAEIEVSFKLRDTDE